VIVDYHMHLRDAEERIAHRVAAIEPFVEVAQARGVDEIGFTEHVYYFRQTRELWSLQYQIERCVYDLDAYVDAVLAAKRRGLPVKLGLEVDWWPPHNERLAEILAAYPFDYLLGSVHWLDGHAVDLEPGVWAHMSVEDVWAVYFDELSRAARSGLFDALSHPDLVKIFGRRPDDAGFVADLWEELAAAAWTGKAALEISTAGLRKQIGELYPDRGLLDVAATHGVPVTLASDAHVPILVGHELGQAVALARAAGYESVTVFDGRAHRQEPLG
jgi:histidinol-phosphatase (PHP family)